MSSTITILGYAVLALMGFALWLFGKLKPETLAPLGALIDRLTSRRRTRIALVAIWWWLGWHFYTNVSLELLAS